MFKYDALIAGCGLTGSVAARHLAEAGKRVLILERRSHIGGNMYDSREEHGILFQNYGPHIFHADNMDLRDFMLRFEEWHEFIVMIGAEVAGKYTRTPFNFASIDVFYSPEDAQRLKEKLLAEFPGKESAPVLEVLKSSDQDIKGYAEFLFENDYAPYTSKQWGIPPDEIDKSVLARVPLRFSYKEGYFTDKFQAVPVHSFTHFFKNLLNHKNITVELNSDALHKLTIHDKRLFFENEPLNIPVVFTGEIDELFGYVYGKLPYRTLRFECEYSEDECRYPDSIVVFPQAEGYTRITEYKSLLFQEMPGSFYAKEHPLNYSNGGGA